ncbi:MAG: UDP-N-acetylglucosamine--N-acetylmuramyl-(pentapeptide) pyrophosphoryl-undecaprenol N-acetylglucosamine transferase [Candidatus Levybacteria bacterium]|nr:UDP-N-acetylglucosamine--N-acetylmuramyl-(pentapeptide) pyrophosphoryl-undecaprenol N-acetylglucosamine transferase [Candidatus Levybacteria bacterium]
MKIVIVAGGGGHFAPALAFLESAPKDWKILIIGRKYSLEGDNATSLEYQTAYSLGLPFRSITTGRLQRKFTKHTIVSLLKLPYGFFQSVAVLINFRPDVVLSFGGYISIPVSFASFILNIPIVIHEQTLGAGISNKIVGFFAKKICVSWESSLKFFPKAKTVLTGNPVRKFKNLASRSPRFGEAGRSGQNSKIKISDNELPLIYITGGSTGSHAINVLIEKCIKSLLQKYRVIHQTGDAREFLDYERLKRLRDTLDKTLQDRYMLVKFINPKEVGEILNSADLVVSRSGINTVTEILLFEKPSLLIPLPISANNEQMENAEFLKEQGLAEVVNQKDLTENKLFHLITSMMDNIKAYRKKVQPKGNEINKNAAEKIVDVIKQWQN